MDGARQIVIPATVSLLCICVVFVPMFNLGGVAGYLFRPMAEAVVFALIGFVRPLPHPRVDDGALSAGRSGTGAATRSRAADAQSVGHVSARVRASIRARPRGISAACRQPRSARAAIFIVGLSGRRRLLVRAVAVPGAEFFPSGRRRTRSNFTFVRRRERASRRRRGCADRVEDAIRAMIPARRARSDRRQHRAAAQRHQLGLQQLRHSRPRRRRHLDHSQSRASRRFGRLCERAARNSAAIVSRRFLRVPSRRYRLADPQLRTAVADRRSSLRTRSE